MEVETSSLRAWSNLSYIGQYPIMQRHDDEWERDIGLRKNYGTKYHICLNLHKSLCSQGSQAPETRGKVWNKEDVLLVSEDQVREHLSKLDICRSLGPSMMHPQVLRELGDVMTSFVMRCKDTPNYLWTTWQLGEVPGDWWKENISPVFIKKKKGDSGNYRLFSLTSVLGKVM